MDTREKGDSGCLRGYVRARWARLLSTNQTLVPVHPPNGEMIRDRRPGDATPSKAASWANKKAEIQMVFGRCS